jgi:hypothetical protein
MLTFKSYLNEDVITANQIDHMENRVKKAIRLLKPVRNEFILYRSFNKKYQGLLDKVTSTRADGIARGGADIADQQKLLLSMDIKNPIFCTHVPRGSTIFGKLHMVIPPENFTIHWSPDVSDLGSHGGIRPDELKPSYKQDWPNKKIENEIIMDAKYYYLLDMPEFVQKIMGKKQYAKYSTNKIIPGTNVRNPRPSFNPTGFDQQFKKYKDLEWWFEERFIGWLAFKRKMLEK